MWIYVCIIRLAFVVLVYYCYDDIGIRVFDIIVYTFSNIYIFVLSVCMLYVLSKPILWTFSARENNLMKRERKTPQQEPYRQHDEHRTEEVIVPISRPVDLGAGIPRAP
jgi:hypothetical protein